MSRAPRSVRLTRRHVKEEELHKHRIWRPYTEMRHYRERGEPLVVARASGARLFDLDGRSYIDGNASWWSSTLLR